MASTENIEAKLCAYVEGELDPAGIVEIEKHLAGNPQHRALLTELVRARHLIQSLPREPVPDDFAEAIHAQLERSVLLDGLHDQAAARPLRISRWPQFMAAAIVALAVGLGVVIYAMMVPRSGRDQYVVGPASARSQPTEAQLEMQSPVGERIAADSPPGPSVASAEPADADAMKESARSMGSSAGAPAASPVALDEAVAGRRAVQPNDTAPTGPGLAVQEQVWAAQERMNSAELARQLKDAPAGLGENALFVVVTTDDAADTSSQVADYLNNNKITFEPVPTTPPQPLNIGQSQVAMLSKQNPTTVQLREAVSEPVPPPNANSAMGADRPSALSAAAPSDKRADDAEPVTIESGTIAPQPEETGDYFARHGGAVVDAAQQPQRLIIARRMTKTQAADLQNSLQRTRNVQRAAVYDQAMPRRDEDAPPGQQFPYEVRSLSPVMEPAASEADDGAARAEAATPPRLGMSVSAAATAPATQAVDAESALPVMPSTKPSLTTMELADSTTQPATMPAAAVAAPIETALPEGGSAGELVDVVIVMQAGQQAAEPAAPIEPASPMPAPEGAAESEQPSIPAATQPTPAISR